MQRVQVYRGWRRVAYSYPALVVLIIVSVFIFKATWRTYVKWAESRQTAQEAVARFESEQARAERVGADIERLGTERGLEEELRNNFQVGKPGEGVIILVGTSTR